MNEKAPELPEWTDCQSAFADGTATPLTEFIRAYEPVGSTRPDDTTPQEWRAALGDLLATARKEAREAAFKEVLAVAEEHLNSPGFGYLLRDKIMKLALERAAAHVSAGVGPTVDEPLLPQTDYKTKPQLDGKERYKFGHLFHEYTFNNCDHGEQAGRVCKGCVVECLAYLERRRAAVASPVAPVEQSDET